MKQKCAEMENEMRTTTHGGRCLLKICQKQQNKNKKKTRSAQKIDCQRQQHCATDTSFENISVIDFSEKQIFASKIQRHANV